MREGGKGMGVRLRGGAEFHAKLSTLKKNSCKSDKRLWKWIACGTVLTRNIWKIGPFSKNFTIQMLKRKKLKGGRWRNQSQL